METRYDFIQIKADVSAEGWIRDNPVVTRAGIFHYRKQDGTIHKEFRPEDEVFKEDSLLSLRGIPITDGHNGIVTKDNSNGIIGTVISPGARSEQNVTAEIVIHDANKLGQRRELSLGYRCDVDDTPGEHNGIRYDSIQKNIRYNHLAVVMKGRAGNARLRLDHNDGVSGTFEMENEQMPDVKLVTVRLDEIDYQASPEVANAYKKALEETTSLQKRFDAIEAERDQLKEKLVDADKRVSDAARGAREGVRERLELEATLTQLELKFDEAEPDIDLKKKVVGKLRPAMKLDGKSDDYVLSAFDLVMEDETDKNKKLAGQKERVDGHNGQKQSPEITSAESYRAAMIARLRQPHQRKGSNAA